MSTEFYANKILQLLRKRNITAGHMDDVSALLGAFQKEGGEAVDFYRALDHAMRKGWLRYSGSHFIVLTNEGVNAQHLTMR